MAVPKIYPSYNHGAGCTFSAAITAGLADGLSMKEAVLQAKKFVTAALKHGFAINNIVAAPIIPRIENIANKRNKTSFPQIIGEMTVFCMQKCLLQSSGIHSAVFKQLWHSTYCAMPAATFFDSFIASTTVAGPCTHRRC